MKKSKFSDNKIRKHFKNKEFDSVFFNLVMQNLSVPFIFKGVLKRKKLKKLIFLTKIRNICSITGRTRSIYKLFRISRIMLRELGSQGLIFGLKKSSW